jgi:hypothetical protein
MEVLSPIGNLVKVLQKVRQSANLFESKLIKNEAATRATLIDPVIKALGWDISNPDMVEFERYYKDTKLDYALYNASGDVKVIIEAKTLKINLDDTKVVTALVTYAISYGIANIFLTNGIVWKHFKQFEPGHIEAESMDLKSDPLIDIAQFLISSLDAAKYWLDEIKPVVEEIEPSTIKAVSVPSTTLPTIKPTISTESFIPLASLERPLLGKNPPKHIRLPDGSIKPIKYWRHILKESILFTLANAPDLKLPFLDKAGKKCILIDYKKMNQKGVIEEALYQGKTVYCFLNFSSDRCLLNALHILACLSTEKLKFQVAVEF